MRLCSCLLLKSIHTKSEVMQNTKSGLQIRRTNILEDIFLLKIEVRRRVSFQEPDPVGNGMQVLAADLKVLDFRLIKIKQ